MKDIILKLFSYYGEFNRKEYLLFGFLAPIIFTLIIGVIMSLFKPIIGGFTTVIGGVGLLVIFSILLSSTIKRARETSSSTLLIMIMWVLFTPIAMLYLMFSANGKNKEKSSSILTIPLIILGITVLGVLVAVFLPKFTG